MAVEKINVEINAKDKASKNIKKVEKSTLSLKKAIGAIGFAVAAKKLKDFAQESINLFLIQEKAEARLKAGTKNLKNLGDGYENTADDVHRLNQDLIEYAKTLQSVTTFGDEQIISAEAMLTTFQLSGEEIKSLTPALLDMAASTEKTTGQVADLNDIAIAMGKAMTMGAGALGRYGIVLTDVQKEQFAMAEGAEKTALLVEILTDNFGGAAEQLRATTAGALASAKNDWGDFKETIGEILAPLLQDIALFISESAIKLQEGMNKIKIAWNSDWNGIRTKAVSAWQAIKTASQLAGAVIELVFRTIELAVGFARVTFQTFFGEQNQFWQEYGTMIHAVVIGAIESIQWLINVIKEAIDLLEKFRVGASLGDLGDFQAKYPAPIINRSMTSEIFSAAPEAAPAGTGVNVQINGGIFGSVDEFADQLVEKLQLSSKVV